MVLRRGDSHTRPRLRGGILEQRGCVCIAVCGGYSRAVACAHGPLRTRGHHDFGAEPSVPWGLCGHHGLCSHGCAATQGLQAHVHVRQRHPRARLCGRCGVLPDARDQRRGGGLAGRARVWRQRWRGGRGRDRGRDRDGHGHLCRQGGDRARHVRRCALLPGRRAAQLGGQRVRASAGCAGGRRSRRCTVGRQPRRGGSCHRRPRPLRERLGRRVTSQSRAPHWGCGRILPPGGAHLLQPSRGQLSVERRWNRVHLRARGLRRQRGAVHLVRVRRDRR
mmetsp:Transcript_15583/g.47586  ORF Transcript_15583/g.47586 Transcript_15583/m.47586 type:complete len:278 (-) Transcript_15583:2291-3124(-)